MDRSEIGKLNPAIPAQLSSQKVVIALKCPIGISKGITMTKAEWIACDIGFIRDYAADIEKKKHDGRSYTVRVFKLEKNGNRFLLECDSYYGYSVLYRNGNKYGDIECRYEDLPNIVAVK